MQSTERSKIGFHVVELVYAVLVLLWYILPFLGVGGDGFSPLKLAETLFGSPPAKAGAAAVVTILAWIVPVICAWKIASFFLGKLVPVAADPERFISVFLNLIESGIVIALVVMHFVSLARSAAYFAGLSPLTYVVTAVSLGYNGYFIVMLIATNSRRSEAYRDYLLFRRTTEENRTVISAVQNPGIQRRLLITFVPIILVIIFVLCLVLLLDFTNTVLTQVKQKAQVIAEKTATSVSTNAGDTIYLKELFSNEAKSNFTGYVSLSYFFGSQKVGGYVVKASTDAKLLATRETREPKFRDQLQLNPATDSYEYFAPITLGKVPIGYIKVDYAREVIFEPVFRTEVKVFVIAVLGMYLSIFLIYFFGRNLVLPILFLRMGVNSIAEKLQGMVKGELKFSPGLLQYSARVGARPPREIKDLSGEVNHMTTVIRGVIPYVSMSTLKHSERETPTNERKTLTLLFTDIRGFTTISEKLPPNKVVEMLNHYLDIQYTIIEENGGDVDKFVGDEVMATFDGPKRDQNACKAAIEIRKAMAREKELAKAQGREEVSIGIGINSGPVVFGSMGARNRMDFTSIGDPVNLAARLEGTNKEYATKTLLTSVVYEKVKDAFICREIDLVKVKGKAEAARIYELLQETKGSSEKLERMRKVFEDSLAYYRKQKWDTAAKGFAALVKDYEDDTSKVFLGRIAQFKEDPPGKDWDGVFTRTSK
jgi:class 3 adenylate cyclase